MFKFLLALWVPCLMVGACAKQAPECRQIFGLNGKIQVGLPAGWEEMPELHESADLEAGSKTADAYLVVVSEKKSILPAQTLEKYSQFTREAIGRAMGFPQYIGPRKSHINSLLALQYEIRAIGKFGTRLVELHTAVESKDYFHQIVLWTSAERFKANEPVMKAITESFREL